VAIDGKDVRNFLLSGKPAEKLFKASAQYFVYDKEVHKSSCCPIT
jgi:hypothetical protein